MTLSPGTVEMIEALLQDHDTRATVRRLAATSITVSYETVDHYRRNMLRRAAKARRSERVGYDHMAEVEPLAVNDKAALAAAKTGCAALHERTLDLFANVANRVGCTITEASVLLNHGPTALATWRKAA